MSVPTSATVQMQWNTSVQYQSTNANGPFQGNPKINYNASLQQSQVNKCWSVSITPATSGSTYNLTNGTLLDQYQNGLVFSSVQVVVFDNTGPVKVVFTGNALGGDQYSVGAGSCSVNNNPFTIGPSNNILTATAATTGAICNLIFVGN